MRFGIFFILIVALFAGLAEHSYAQTTTASTTESGGFFDAVITNITGVKDTVEDIVPQSQSVLSSATTKRLTNLAANISNRLDGINARLRQISGRLETRINKQAEAGFNVDQARVSLANANELLSTAENDLKNIDRDVYRAFRSLTPKEDWRDVRATYIKARDNIRAAHTELKNTVTALKSATPAATIATTTASTTE